MRPIRKIVGKCPVCNSIISSGIFSTLAHCVLCGKDIDLKKS